MPEPKRWLRRVPSRTRPEPGKFSLTVAKRDDKAQSRAFIRTARELGCDEDQEAFKRALRQIASAPSPKRRDKSQDDGKPS